MARDFVIQIEPADGGRPLGELVRKAGELSWSEAKRLIESGKVFVGDRRELSPGARVPAGATVALRMASPRPRDPAAEVRIVHEDPHVVVIDKPSGVSTVPFGDRESGTAMDLLRAAWRRMGRDAGHVPLHVVHRIDKDTSGLVVFAKTKRAEVGLGAQFRAHTVARRYLCVALGEVRFKRVESRLVRDRGDGLRGSARAPNQGKRAVTHVEPLEVWRKATLCAVRLETGKTHQIRIHFAESGAPLIGETVYVRDLPREESPRLAWPRLLLHAETLGFEHPITGASLELATRETCFDVDAVRRRLDY
jgi:23S rRNA pseudouridine1911/1915/1917 synthase